MTIEQQLEKSAAIERMATNTRDDRITCIGNCRLYRGITCGAAIDGKRKDVGNRYTPIADLPRRCEYFEPLAKMDDQRTGAKRWPSLKLDRAAAVAAEKEAQRGGLGK